MSLHTKGPWSVLDNRSNKTGNGGVHIVAGGTKIARVLYRPVDPLGEVESERLANAALMAAAPDLLKAAVLGAGNLSAAVEILKQVGHASTAAKAQADLDHMLAAIEKATGSAP
jgi:hypothetical protein